MSSTIFILCIVVAVFLLGIGIWSYMKDTKVEDGKEDQTESGIMQDYDIYKLTINDKVKYGVIGGIYGFVIVYAFYKSIIFSFILSAISVVALPRLKINYLREKRKELLLDQFNEVITYISNSLEVGNSVENAIKESMIETKSNLGTEALIYMEIAYIVRQIENGVNVEEAFYNLATRSKIDDIKSFADVFETSKRTSGDIKKVIKKTSLIVRGKRETIREIQLMIADKKFEQKIMSCLPIIMILMLAQFSSDFFNVVYDTFGGRMLMTVALTVYVISNIISKKIVDIEV